MLVQSGHHASGSAQVPHPDAAVTPEAQTSTRAATQAHLQAAPHLPRGEARQELHAGARGVGAVQRIDDAVDVVQGQRVQDAVPWAPLPGTAQGCHLSAHAAVGVQSTYTAAAMMALRRLQHAEEMRLQLVVKMPSGERMVLSQQEACLSALQMACSLLQVGGHPWLML